MWIYVYDQRDLRKLAHIESAIYQTIVGNTQKDIHYLEHTSCNLQTRIDRFLQPARLECWNEQSECIPVQQTPYFMRCSGLINLGSEPEQSELELEHMQLSLGTEQFTFVIVPRVVLGSPALSIGVLETHSLVFLLWILAEKRGLIVPPRHRTVVLGSYFTCRVSSEVSF